MYLAAGLEWCLGLWLVSGLRQAAALVAGATAMIAFTGMLTLALTLGFSGDCGCGFGSMDVQQALVRNGVVLALLAATLVAVPRLPRVCRKESLR